jgi:hypothetical protein
MPNGISGDTNVPVLIGADPTEDLMLIELRTLSNLLQGLLGTNQAVDQLEVLRNDQAYQLSIPLPLPGASL